MNASAAAEVYLALGGEITAVNETLASTPEILNQHLIDPVICIRCNTCEETCPVDAITHDSRNYVVKADVCNACGACLSPCPTGAEPGRNGASVQR